MNSTRVDIVRYGLPRGIADSLGARDVEHLELELAVSHC